MMVLKDKKEVIFNLISILNIMNMFNFVTVEKVVSRDFAPQAATSLQQP